MTTYKDRINITKNIAAKKLFKIIEEKQTNLALACDETKQATVLDLADKLGPSLCVFKTHIDIIVDFTLVFIKEIQELAKKHNFLLFEDRKFGDIGNTVKMQYEKGIYRIVEWSNFTNATALPGPGLIEGLMEAAKGYLEKGEARGLLLWAQITSEGNLADDAYTKKCIEFAKQYPDFIAGFIGNGGDVEELKKLRSLAGDEFVIMTPGVKLAEGGDKLGQRYTSPEDVAKVGSDVLIVGRGIYQADDPAAEVKKYVESGWKGYQSRI